MIRPLRVATLTFTYSRDQHVAYHVWKYADRYADASFWCVEEKDKDMVCPPNVTKLVRNFQRKGNLNGAVCVRNMAKVALELFDMGYDIVIKGDSDAVVRNREWARSPLHRTMPHVSGIMLGEGISGACYRYNRAAAEAAIAFTEDGTYIPITSIYRAKEPEDLTFHAAVRAASGIVDTLPCERMHWFDEDAPLWPLEIPDCDVLYLCNGTVSCEDLLALAYDNNKDWNPRPFLIPPSGQ